MNNSYLRILKLKLPAQSVKMGPPVGTILGQFGLKIKDFCDKFNKKSTNFSKGILLNTTIKVYRDKTFDFTIKNIPNSFLLTLISNELTESDVNNLYKIYLLNKIFIGHNVKIKTLLINLKKYSY